MHSWLPPDLVLRRAAPEESWSDARLSRELRRGDLLRLRPGAYLPGTAPVDEAQRHRLPITATPGRGEPPARGRPPRDAVLGRGPAPVHVTRRPPASSEVGHLRCHVARPADEEVVAVDGVPVTSPARTALNLARTLPHEPAVVALDAALRLRPGQDPGDVVFQEKRREDAFRDEDWGVVRWTWADLTPAVLGPRVRRALDRGRRRSG